MQNIFNKCPACCGQLIITECQCRHCRLQIRGEFRLGGLATLTDDELTFIQVFLSARGNLSEVERVLGISYPTIRHKLDEINAALKDIDKGLRTVPGKDSDEPTDALALAEESRKQILQDVADGKISPREAAKKLRIISVEGD